MSGKWIPRIPQRRCANAAGSCLFAILWADGSSDQTGFGKWRQSWHDHSASVEKEEQLHWQKNCFRALCDLAKNYDLDKAEREKKALEAKQNIREKLRLAFPGSYGDYLSLHFGKYLGEPLDTPEKEEAYRKMVSFFRWIAAEGNFSGTGTIFDANHGVAAAADVEKK